MTSFFSASYFGDGRMGYQSLGSLNKKCRGRSNIGEREAPHYEARHLDCCRGDGREW